MTDFTDRAIEHEQDDRLNRLPFVDNLIKALVTEERDLTGTVVARHSAGVVIGLTGKWGSGKSSILNLTRERLLKLDHVAVATFNPWLFKGRDELLTAFFSELRDALGRNLSEHGRGLVEALDRYQWAINGAAHVGAIAFDVHGGGGAVTKATAKTLKSFAKWRAKKLEPWSPHDERRSLEKKLETKKTAVVVLIDELDRVEDEDVRAVAQLVKAVGDIKGISYLVAYDAKRVVEALGTKPEPQRSGAAYLEKIIQHPIPLRPLFSDDVDALLAATLAHQGIALRTEISENEQAVYQHIKNAITTPREIKRLVGSFAILEPMVRGEISEIDTLAYCWVVTKSDELREELMLHFDLVVDDPPETELVVRYAARSGHLPSPEDILGKSAKDFDGLLRLLFPRFGKSHEGEPGARISRRRNLVRLLYLGNPPGMMSRNDVLRLWNFREIGPLADELREALRQGALSLIIDRLDDLLPSLEPGGDAIFWPALSRALLREEEWAQAPITNGALADDAATYLTRFGMRATQNALRVKRVLAALEADGDLVIGPWLLRKHLYRFGLTKNRGPQPGDFVLDESETKAMLTRELPRYRAALLDGTLLRRVPNIEAFFVIENVEAWDDELRDSLTSQLKDPRARGTLASLLVPPGYAVGRNTLEELVDAEAVGTWMDESGQGRPPGETWLEKCLARFRRALAGKDTIGWDGREDQGEGAG